MNNTSNFTPFQFPVQVTIDGLSLDYLLTVDETGHVFEAVPTIFELPLTAQKLILGETDGQLERKIRAYTRLFKYLVPLALVRKLPTYQKVLTPLVEEIERRLQEKRLTWEELPFNSLADTSARQVLGIFGTIKHLSSPWEEAWKMIIVILESLNNPEEGKELISIAHRYPEVASNFLPAVIPLFNQYVQYNTFTEIRYAKIRTESFKTYLLEELEHPSCAPCADGILSILAGFGPDQNDIYGAALRFYERGKNLDGPTSDRLMDILKHYPTPRTKEVGFEIIRLNDRQNAFYAARTLIQMGVAQNEILDLMMPSFRKATATASMATFSVLSNCISPEYMPAAEEVLDVAVRILSKSTDASIVVGTTSIANKNGTYLLVDRLFDLLYHEAIAVKEMVLWNIKYFHNNVKAEFFAEFYGKFYGNIKYLNHRTKIDFKPFTSKRFIARYWELAKDSNTGIAKAAIRLIAQVGYEQHSKDYINLLLDLAEQDSRKEIQYEVVDAINVILRRIPYAPQIEPFYLSILDSDHPARAATIYGLRFSPNQAFKKAIWEKYQDDRDNSVSRAIKNELLKTPKESLKIRIQNLLNRWSRTPIFVKKTLR